MLDFCFRPAWLTACQRRACLLYMCGCQRPLYLRCVCGACVLIFTAVEPRCCLQLPLPLTGVAAFSFNLWHILLAVFFSPFVGFLRVFYFIFILHAAQGPHVSVCVSLSIPVSVSVSSGSSCTTHLAFAIWHSLCCHTRPTPLACLSTCHFSPPIDALLSLSSAISSELPSLNRKSCLIPL